MSLFEHFTSMFNTTEFSNATLAANEAVDWHVEYEEANQQLQQSFAEQSETTPTTLWDHWANNATEEQFASGPQYDFFGHQGAEQPLIEEGLSIENSSLNTIEKSGEFGGSMLLGIAGATLAEGLASHQATLDTNKDLLGEGVAGHTFASSYQARSDAAHDNLVGSENAAMIGASSVLGPFGTAAGMLASSVNSVLNTNSPVTVTTNTGDQIAMQD